MLKKHITMLIVMITLIMNSIVVQAASNIDTTYDAAFKKGNVSITMIKNTKEYKV